jgi:hypothetical protein
MEQKLTQGEISGLKNDLALISRHRIYFGHMSVGENIIRGLTELYSRYSEEKLNLVNLHEQRELPESYFAHSFIGQNGRPGTKCQDFSQMVQKLSPQLEFAIMKFCFVDIVRESNVQEIFEQYRKTITNLQEQYPQITFIHMTVPLISEEVSLQIKLKRFVKKMIGRRDYSPLDNIKRNSYNTLLLETYQNQPVFDIARVESTYPDGSREIHQFEGAEYNTLIFDYTYDSGHLNEKGSLLAARELIKVLTKAITEKSQ